MPVVVMAPVEVVAPMPIVADAARAVMGQDHPAAVVRIIIGVIVIRVIGRTVEDAPVKVVVGEPVAARPIAGAKTAVAIAAAVEDRTGAKSAAMEYGAAAAQGATVKHRTTAAVKCGTAAMESSTAMETSTAVEASTATETSTAGEASSTVEATSTAATTDDFGRQSVGSGFRRGHGARIDQRERLSALRDGRQRQHCGCRETETTGEAAPGI